MINTSGTLNAALDATRDDGTPLELHLSTHLPADLWIVEVRRPGEFASEPFPNAIAGETLRLPGSASVTLLAPYRQTMRAPERRPKCGCGSRPYSWRRS